MRFTTKIGLTFETRLLSAKAGNKEDYIISVYNVQTTINNKIYNVGVINTTLSGDRFIPTIPSPDMFDETDTVSSLFVDLDWTKCLEFLDNLDEEWIISCQEER